MERFQEAKNLCGHAPIARLRPGVHQLATHLAAIRFETFEGRRESEVSVLTAKYCSTANIKTQCPGYNLSILYDLNSTSGIAVKSFLASCGHSHLISIDSEAAQHGYSILWYPQK
jgi:hypothetical protein